MELSWLATKRECSECFRAAFLTEQLKIGPAAIGASSMLATRPNHHPKPSATERERERRRERERKWAQNENGPSGVRKCEEMKF
ncbi:hypothetical protein QQF64_028203 [Cirrhinus molitorella]|uniref:Uncharacterized protein n=1 Tax=Cirrhinus molitorella TaxID=172907 RepID=A0ABR3N6A6_9TELE